MKRAIKGLVAALLVVALGVLALGCGSDDSDSGGAVDVDSAVEVAESWATTTPEASGELDSVTWGLPYGEPSTLDYLQAAAYSDNAVLSSVCEGLLRTAPDLTVEPSLAEEVENPDPTTYVYKLREGVTFSNGDPLTAEDAAYSLNRNLDPKSGTFWADWYVNVKKIVATDDLTVEVTLKQPDETFNKFMGTAAGTVVQKKFVEQQGDDFGGPKGGLMCTGPFVLTDWTPGQSITVERNEDYWDSDNLAKVQEITFEFVTDPSALTAGLESGEIDGAYDVPLTLESSDAGTVYLGQSTQFVASPFTPRPGPVQDVRIREALSLVIDRSAVADTIYKDSAVGLFSYYMPATWTYSRDIFAAQLEALPSPDTVDVEAAQALVDEYVAEEGEVRELKLQISADDPSSRQLATYIESEAEKIGIPIKVVSLPSNQAIAVAFDPELKKQYDIIVGTGYIDIGDPLAWVIWGLTPDGAFNDFGYDNPEVTELIEQARQTDDDDERADLLGQIQDIAYGEDYISIFLVNLAERLYLGNRVTGVPASLPSYLYYPWSRDLGAAGSEG